MRQKKWWIGFNNLKYLMQWMGFKTHANWPLVTKLNLHRVRTQHLMGEFLILIGPAWPFKIQKNHAWPLGPELRIDLWSNQLNLNKIRTLGWFFHPDWSCLTFPKITIQLSGFESQNDLWSQIWTWARFEPITTRVSFSSWLVLSDHSKSQQFLLFSSFCLFVICFGSSMVVLPRVLRFPPTFVV